MIGDPTAARPVPGTPSAGTSAAVEDADAAAVCAAGPAGAEPATALATIKPPAAAAADQRLATAAEATAGREHVTQPPANQGAARTAVDLVEIPIHPAVADGLPGAEVSDAAAAAEQIQHPTTQVSAPATPATATLPVIVHSNANFNPRFSAKIVQYPFTCSIAAAVCALLAVVLWLIVSTASLGWELADISWATFVAALGFVSSATSAVFFGIELRKPVDVRSNLALQVHPEDGRTVSAGYDRTGRPRRSMDFDHLGMPATAAMDPLAEDRAALAIAHIAHLTPPHEKPAAAAADADANVQQQNAISTGLIAAAASENANNDASTAGNLIVKSVDGIINDNSSSPPNSGGITQSPAGSSMCAGSASSNSGSSYTGSASITISTPQSSTSTTSSSNNNSAAPVVGHDNRKINQSPKIRVESSHHDGDVSLPMSDGVQTAPSSAAQRSVVPSSKPPLAPTPSRPASRVIHATAEVRTESSDLSVNVSQHQNAPHGLKPNRHDG